MKVVKLKNEVPERIKGSQTGWIRSQSYEKGSQTLSEGSQTKK